MFDLSPEGMKKIAAAGESQSVEFKESLPDDHSIARVLSTFANTEGGILLIGVDENGKIVGMHDEDVMRSLYHLRAVSSSLLPYLTKVEAVDTGGGLYIVYVVVEKAPEQYFPILTSRGEFYTRHQSKAVLIPTVD